jgi:cytochrome c biogenesis protein CcmG, thiol:disulfide interchange protein DsbE
MGLGAAAVFSLGCGAADMPTPEPGHPLLGRPAPEFSAEDVMGEGPIGIKEAHGRVVVLDFWATYCMPCKASFPKYQQLLEQLGPDLAIIGVSVDDPDDTKKEQLEEFVKVTGAKFAIAWDKDKSAAQLYSPPKMPTAFVIDRAGVVRHIHSGYETGEEALIAEEIKALLKK